jgi:HlyD family secretion protein
MGAAHPALGAPADLDAAIARPGAAHEFLPAYLRIQREPPSPLPRRLLYCLLALLVCIVLWSVLGRLDIIASADGKLVPRSYLKIVQPADGGILREILVEEGATVLTGQPLLRLDPSLAQADTRALRHELSIRALQARRIDAELADKPLERVPDDPPDLWTRVEAQFQANRKAYHDAVALEAANVVRLDKELRAASEALTKLQRTVPIYRSTAQRFETLRKEGFVSELYQLERERELIEKDQDLRAQDYTVEGLHASLDQARSRLRQVTSSYRQQLHAERAGVESLLKKATEDLAKQHYRNALIELTAPQAGIVKDLAAHTAGTVVAPGAVLLTLVPHGDELQADVMIRNLDVGFVRAGQTAKVKLVAYPFQKYGTITGTVVRVTPDASETNGGRPEEVDSEGKSTAHSAYRARVALGAQRLSLDGVDLALVSGMQVTAEINLGDRSVLEYLLAPVQKAWLEAARER